jgi:hypothetical protein
MRSVTSAAWFIGAALVGCLLVFPSPAKADVTVFAGRLASGQPRTVFGGSAGRFYTENVGFEFEVAVTPGSGSAEQHKYQIFTGNLLIQSSLPRGHRPQVYGAIGMGIYGETSSGGGGSGEVFIGSFGGGVKVKLTGPFRVRADYRLFRLGEAADAGPGFVLHRHPQRVSVGIGVAF